MSDWWMDERDRDRERRERDWRRQSDPRERERWAAREDRSFGRGARFEGPERDRVFGERDTGAGYNLRDQPRPGGGGYGAGGSYGRGESYGRGAGGGPDRREDYGGRPAWQDPDYEGVSPAMRQGEYELERGRREGRFFQHQDYTRGGRFYGDDARERVYREEYGQGGREYGPVPRGYDAGRYEGRGHDVGGHDADRYERDLEHRYEPEMRHRASGGTGGYDYERGYGDAGRGRDGGERWRSRGEESGDFLQRAGERISSWFGEVRRDLAGERGHRGRGPKDYKRADDRISDDAHQRLTDDAWLDASNISISVSGGEVTMSGTVDNREAKHRAERLVEDIPGVNHVQNNLRVQSGSYFTSAGKGFGDSVQEAQMRGEGGGNGDAASRTTTRRT